ncbi:MmgE/PrpD family protein [Sphingomonas radiodurans]|uniref:MmgE/PrpD family protein n=1 Tax=Sphingomonas radiodurans TaxID=2890321 RepID=UPI001E324D32|nr:MmgE/PrpD family protein [Sphingomonas radiodurans]WBH18007.1 MmgE/PrpD family protein [Sphingomonas radiodurans]
MSATTALLDFAHADHRLSADVRDHTRRLLADTLAVGAAGAASPAAQAVRAAVASWGVGDAARLLDRAERLPAPSAAFFNGFAIHCLEWDSVHEAAVVHALSVVTAAVGAAIDRRRGCSADEALGAIAVGVDIASGLGIAATSALRFFRPATAGCIGGALAVARIERLSRAQFDDVLGLAYSACAGTMQAHVEGSVALPLQVATAARAAISAVDLVRAGLTGPHDALEGPFGYFKLIDDGDLASYRRDLGNVWRIAEVSTKPYPSGRASHATLATLADLMRETAVAPDTVAAIHAHVPPLIARLVGRAPTPDMTPAYARLCLPFLAALMLCDGRIDPRRVTAESFADPKLLSLAGRMTVTVDDNPDPNALSPQKLTVVRTDGARIERTIADTYGSPAAPLDASAATAKRDLARELANPAVDPRLFDDPLAYFTQPEAA